MVDIDRQLWPIAAGFGAAERQILRAQERQSQVNAEQRLSAYAHRNAEPVAHAGKVNRAAHQDLLDETEGAALIEIHDRSLQLYIFPAHARGRIEFLSRRAERHRLRDPFELDA